MLNKQERLWYQLSTASTKSKGKTLLGFGLEVHLEAIITRGRTPAEIKSYIPAGKSLLINPRLVSVTQCHFKTLWTATKATSLKWQLINFPVLLT